MYYIYGEAKGIVLICLLVPDVVLMKLMVELDCPHFVWCVCVCDTCISLKYSNDIKGELL